MKLASVSGPPADPDEAEAGRRPVAAGEEDALLARWRAQREELERRARELHKGYIVNDLAALWWRDDPAVVARFREEARASYEAAREWYARQQEEAAREGRELAFLQEAIGKYAGQGGGNSSWLLGEFAGLDQAQATTVGNIIVSQARNLGHWGGSVAAIPSFDPANLERLPLHFPVEFHFQALTGQADRREWPPSLLARVRPAELQAMRAWAVAESRVNHWRRAEYRAADRLGILLPVGGETVLPEYEAALAGRAGVGERYLEELRAALQAEGLLE